jgi:acyl-CoA thioester hydrolase
MNQHPAAIPPNGRHRYTLRVYYEDTDAGGIVYHATYLRFAERARTEALRDLTIPHADLLQNFKLMFVVRRAEVDYLRPARVDDSLVVETEVLEAGGASATLRQTIYGPHGACAVLRLRLACVTAGGNAGSAPDAGRPARLPPRWRAGLQAMHDARPAESVTGATDSGAIEGVCGGSSS